MERKESNNITLEMIEELKIEVMLREDELAIKTDKSLERSGTLNDPDLCETANKVEDFRMQIDTLEKQLKQGKEILPADANPEQNR